MNKTMKRFYLILLGVSLLSLSSFAGSLYPTVFTPNADVVNPIMWYGKIWNVRYDFIDDSHQSLVLYSDVTESIVDGKTYVPICVCERKLIVRGVTLRSDINQSEATRLLYRQEGDKVYYLSQENNAEFILFDYGLKEGEKFKAQDGEQYVVTETGYFEEYDKNIYAPGQNKPRMLRLRAEESGKEDVWIEGIGSVKWGIVPKYVLKASAVFKDTPIDAHVFRSSTNGDIAIYDYLFNINEENYKLINYELGEECSKEEDGLRFTFIEDTLCVSGAYCPDSSFGPECIECLVTSDNTIVMAFYGFHVITTNSTYRKIDVKIPGFKAGTYIFGTETLVCKGTQKERDNYVPFVGEGKTWYCGYYHTWEVFPATLEDPEGEGIDCIFTMRGDTLIGDREYKRVFRQFEEYYGDAEQHYFCCVREEACQVFIIEEGTTEEKLIYDFSRPNEVIKLNFKGYPFTRTDGWRRYDFLPGQLEYKICDYVDDNAEEYNSLFHWIDGVGSPFYNPFAFEFSRLLFNQPDYGEGLSLRSCIMDGKQIFSATWMAVPCVPLAINDRTYIDNTKKSTYLYDLSGRRVINPKRGLYIQGGRKVLIE